MRDTPSTRRVLAATIATAALSVGVVLTAPTASAGPEQDQQFQKIVADLGVPADSPEQAGMVGMEICTKVDQGKIQPASTVRGLINTLVSRGLDKGQATHMVWGAVQVYCPQFSSIVGR